MFRFDLQSSIDSGGSVAVAQKSPSLPRAATSPAGRPASRLLLAGLITTQVAGAFNLPSFSAFVCRSHLVAGVRHETGERRRRFQERVKRVVQTHEAPWTRCRFGPRFHVASRGAGAIAVAGGAPRDGWRRLRPAGRGTGPRRSDLCLRTFCFSFFFLLLFLRMERRCSSLAAGAVCCSYVLGAQVDDGIHGILNSVGIRSSEDWSSYLTRIFAYAVKIRRPPNLYGAQFTGAKLKLVLSGTAAQQQVQL
uniref:Uncharacterized protein n=1 Tax=Oryza brachyantha TaxID=4533 RepID=J3MM01_ORYBR